MVLINTKFLPEEREIHDPYQAPNPWDLYQGDKPPEHLALKTNRAYVQKTQRTRELRFCS